MKVYAIDWLGGCADLARVRRDGERYDFVVVETGELRAYTVSKQGLGRLRLDDDYDRVFALDPAHPDGPGPIYDQEDAFFVPLGGLGGVSRPGPVIMVYQARGEGAGHSGLGESK